MTEVVTYRMGEYVEARKDSSDPFRSGQIVCVHKQSGLYDVGFFPKGEALDIPADNIRKVNDPRNDELLASPRKEDIRLPEPTEKPPFPLKIGEQVEALRENKDLWRFGVVAAINEANKTVDVIYSDHFRESNLPLDRVRSFYLAADEPVATTTPSTSEANVEVLLNSNDTPKKIDSSNFSLGMKVEGNYRSRGKFYPATLQSIRPDNTFDLLYDDGETEMLVESQNIRYIETTKQENSSSSTLKEGMKIEANYRGRGLYFPGRIRRDRGDRTYDIDYDDGESEIKVKEEWIKTLDKRQDKGPSDRRGKLEEGLKVEANYRGKGRYYPGRIKSDRGDGTYDIDYDDGEFETRVKEEWIRWKDSPVESSLGFSTGMKIEANYRQKGRWYPGHIRAVHQKEGEGEGGNITYDIDYDDGESERRVKADLIRFPRNDSSPPTIHEWMADVPLPAGQKVEANYRGKGRYYPGIIKRVQVDGRYEIDYDDGEFEKGVARHHLRILGGLLDPVANNTPTTNHQQEVEAAVFGEGLRVEVNYQGRGKWYPGKIQSVRSDEKYDIVMDDGEREEAVAKDCLRVLQIATNATRSVKRLEEGMKVEANFRGRGKYFPGKIRRDRGDGTYDIDYDDGDCEFRVKEEMIRCIATMTTSSSAVPTRFTEGMRVEVNYHEGGQYFPGTIKRVNEDGSSYAVDYDDGIQQSNVAERLIRPSTTITATTQSSPPLFQPGDLVEVNYRERGRYFRGKILRAPPQTADYDILFDDGEEQCGVSSTLLRPPRISYTEGMRIEGNYQGEGVWYPGKIVRVVGEQSYEVLYDDGEREMAVPGNRLRAEVLDPRYNVGLVVEMITSEEEEEGAERRSGKIVKVMTRPEGIFYTISLLGDRTGEVVEDIPEQKLHLPRLMKPTPVRPAGPPPSSSSSLSSTTTTTTAIPSNGESKLARPPIGKPLSSSSSNPTAIPNPSNNTSNNPNNNNNTSLSTDSPLKHHRRIKESAGGQQGLVVGRYLRLEANYQQSNLWYPVSLIREHPEDQTVDVEYEHTREIALHLPVSQLRMSMPSSSSSSHRNTITSSSTNNSGGNPFNPFHLFQVDALVEIKDFRQSSSISTSNYNNGAGSSSSSGGSTSQGKWLKGRIISLDYAQEIAQVRLIASNERVENVCFEEMRLLRASNNHSTTNNPNTTTISANGSRTGIADDKTSSTVREEELQTLRVELQERTVEIQQLKATILSMSASRAAEPVAVATSSPESNGQDEQKKPSQSNEEVLLSKMKVLEEQVAALMTRDLPELKRKDEDLGKDYKQLQSQQAIILQRLKEKKILV